MTKKKKPDPSKTEEETEEELLKRKEEEAIAKEEQDYIEDEKLREVLRGSGDLKDIMAGQKLSITNVSERWPAFKRFASLLTADENREVFRKFAITSLLMVLVPITTFYIGLDVFLSYGVSQEQAPVFAAIAAACTVQLVSIGYVVMTCIEERQLRKQKTD
eukprot:TRINITY_DN14544_c0_g1_i1.p1 TRINITY_DN14544_c0_g1~~TRINITY_DN14544_c0_g1_i1.p1  ORF type:complete len:161 (+),score=41.51 TRINITY_DN14544_c0_g1_i1:74-556(+)